MFDKIVEGNPLLQSSKNNYYIKLIKKKLIFTPKNSEEDFIFNSSKKELTEKMNEIVGGGASVEIRSSNAGMQRAIDLFGDKLTPRRRTLRAARPSRWPKASSRSCTTKPRG